jgi:hypothetical protein
VSAFAQGRRITRRDAALALAPGAAWVLSCIVCLAVLLQIRCGAIGDVSWLITVDEKWLSGATPYVDIIETDPPGALLVYWPAVALARSLGLAPELLVAVFGFATVGGALLLSASIVRRAGFVEALSPISLGLALIAATLLPGRAFDERDFFAAILGTPYLALAAARAARAPVSLSAAIAAGLGAGAMIAIKPPYALVLIAIAPYLVARLGWRSLFGMVEFYVAGAVTLVFVAATWFFFPAYFTNVGPIVAEIYLPARAPMSALIANAGVLLGAVMTLSLSVGAGRIVRSPLIATPLLGALGALAAFFIQGKGWLYHIYPALDFLTLAIAVALAKRGLARNEAAALLLVGLAAAIAVTLIDGWPIQIALLTMVVAGFLLPQAMGAGGEPPLLRIARMAVPACLGVLIALYFHPIDGESDPALARALKRLGPHPTIGAITDGLGLGHPLAREIGAIWAQRAQGMVMAGAARYQMSLHPDDLALRARMEKAVRADRDLLVEDLRKNRPDAILVGKLGTPFNKWAWNDPEIAAARADYVYFADNGNPKWPASIYVRKELIGLRPTLDVTTDAAGDGK